MNEKYFLKMIQSGKTQQIRTVQTGAGITGQGVEIQAVDAARFQLVNVVTLASPAKLQLKRVGHALHLALPGGDIDAPDLIIQDYFKVSGASLQGSAISGEWMSYDTSSLASSSPTGLLGQTADTAMATNTPPSTVTLGGGSAMDTVLSHPWLLAGGLGVVAAAAAGGGGGGGGGSETSTSTTPLGILQSYANATHGSGVTAPTLATYKEAGIKALAALSETTANAEIDDTAVSTAMGTTWLAALNSALDKRTDGSTLTVAQVQALVDSYYRILSEADGVVNTTTDVVVYPNTGVSHPLATDYTQIGATVGNAKSVDLLNDFVGLSAKTAVDTVDEINVVAKAAYNIMLHAGTTAASGTAPGTYTLDSEWISGLTALGITGVTNNNLAAVKAALAGHTDGTAIDTVQEIKDLLKTVIATQQLKDYANASNGTGVTVPTLTTYSNAGIKTFNSLSDTSSTNRKALNDSSTVNGSSNTFLTADVLNSALDKLDGNSMAFDTTYTGTVQKMVDSYYRIFSEADGKYLGDSNGGASYYNNSDAAHTADTDVYADTSSDATQAAAYNDPTLADYSHIGITVADAIGSTTYDAATATGNETLDLLNDAIGRLGTSAVDSAAEIQGLATTANDVMLLAKGSSATQTDANLIAGLNLLLGLNTTTGINTNNLAAMKAAVGATADTGLGVDTVSKLMGLLTLAQLRTFTDDSAALGAKTVFVPTLTTYSDAGIKTFNSLSDTSNANRKALNDSSTVNGASNTFLTADVLNSALDRLEGSSLTFDTTYTGTVQKMVDSYYRILSEADGKYLGDSNGGASYYNNSDAAHTADTDVYADTSSNTDNDPSLADYSNIGITVADAIGTTTYDAATATGNETLDLLNDAMGRLGTGAVDTAAEIQGLATTANDVMLLAKGSSATQTDANLIAGLNLLLGLNTTTGINTNNLAAMKAAIGATADTGLGVDTVSELMGLLGLVRLQLFTDDTAAAGAKSVATPTLQDWSAVGLSANTSLTDATQVALNTATYWKTTNPSNGLNALNSALDTYAGSALGTFNGTAMSNGVLQSIVDSYGRILQEADGSRTTNTNVSTVSTNPLNNGLNGTDVVVQDLLNVGVKHSGTMGGTSASDTGIYYSQTGQLLASSVGILSSTLVDTVSELNSLTDIAENVMKMAEGASVTYTTDAQWVTALNSLGITGATSANMAAVKTAIDTANASGVDSCDELQAIVSLARVNDYAAQNLGYVIPTLADYQILTQQGAGNHLYTDAKSAYLNAYNDFVDTQAGITSIDTIENMVAAYNSILDMADGRRNNTPATEPVAADYNTVLGNNLVSGAGAGTETYLLNDIVNGLYATQIDAVSELQGVAGAIKKVLTLSNNTVQTITRAELTSLGLTDGNGHTVSDAYSSNSYYISDAELANFLNSQVKGAGSTAVDTFAELQSLLNAAILAA